MHAKVGRELIHGPSAANEREYMRRTAPAFHRTHPAPLAASSAVANGACLRGVVVYFAGFTDRISATHLRRLVIAHGGRSLSFFQVTKVTHIIATELAAAKQAALSHRHERGAQLIALVHPNWVLDSARRGIRAKEADYALNKQNEAHTIDHYYRPGPQLSTTTTKARAPKRTEQMSSAYPSDAEQPHDLSTESKQSADLPRHNPPKSVHRVRQLLRALKGNGITPISSCDKLHKF